MTHRVSRPGGRLLFVAGGASVRYLIFIRHCRRDDSESVCAHKGAGYSLAFDLGHVAGHTLAPWATVLVVGVLFHRCHVRAIR